MNRIRAIVHLACRGYRGINKNRRSTENVTRQTPMVQPHMPVDQFNIGEDDDVDDIDDLDAYESNFSTVGEFNKLHDRELEIRKLKLKNQIVKRKYFKTTEPATLTLGEKHQIRLLHEKDPEEWSVDKLGESFPASREAILKVLRAKWWPRSIKTIENYDKTVKNNWELFKKGRLPVEPELRAHLEKFKNRDIKIMEPEEMEKFLKPKPFFPKPKSTVFADIITGYEKERESKNVEDPITDKPEIAPKKITSGLKTIDVISKPRNKQPMMLDAFLKTHVDGFQETTMTPVNRVILEEHKSQRAEAYKAETLVQESQNEETATKSLEKMIERNYEKPEVVKTEQKSQPKVKVKVIEENSLETGIIFRHRKEGSDDDYPEFIKIPPKSYKRGATYKVEDRYYDDDGVFLYRVVGLKV